METKTKDTEKTTLIKVYVNESRKEKLRDFRAKRQLAKKPISSDEKAILHAIDKL